MIFAENGINFPEELLNAQSADRVVFVCGAGISIQATSGQMPTFQGLARDVMECLPPIKRGRLANLLDLHLGEHNTDDLRLKDKLLLAVEHLGVDRVFTEFKDEFHATHVDEAIARALKGRVREKLNFDGSRGTFVS